VASVGPIQVMTRIGGTPGAPPTLLPGQLAYNQPDVTDPTVPGDILYIGDGLNVTELVGRDRQVELWGDQTITGQKTIDISDLKITGGEANDFLTTDGQGNLAFSNVVPGGGLTQVTTDGVTLSGLGTSASPLSVVPETVAVATDGTTIIGTGTATSPLQAVIPAHVASFNTRTGAVVLTLGDITGAGGAPLASPDFTGIPTGPTPTAGTSTSQLATTAFVTAAIGAIPSGVASFNGRTGIVTLALTDVTGVGGAPLASPALTGTPTAPTPTAGNSSASIATTAFVAGAIAAIPVGVTSFNTRTGAVSLTLGDVTGVGGAPLASPAFTGTPTVPTASAGTNTTQAASTAFVTAAVAASVTGVTAGTGLTGGGTSGNVTLALATPVSVADGGTAATTPAGALSSLGAAPLASPALTGTPTAPTASAGTDNTQIATTAFVTTAISGITAGVTSFNTRTGTVTLELSDITGAGGAPLASPSLTGTPTAPTAAAGTNSTQIATTAFIGTALGSYLPLSGGTLSGNLTMGSGAVITTVSGTTLTLAATAAGVSVTGGGINISGGGVNATNGFFSSGGNITLTGGGNIIVGAAGVAGGGLVIQSAGGSLNLYDSNGGTFFWSDNSQNGTRVWSNANNFGVFQMDLSGNLVITGSLTQGSDEAHKTNIAPLRDGIDLIRRLIPKSFSWKSNPEKTNWGFVAQDVEGVIPAAVSRAPAGGGEVRMGLDITAILAALTLAVQQLDERLSAALGA
jgi:hypothetical protein